MSMMVKMLEKMPSDKKKKLYFAKDEFIKKHTLKEFK